MRALDRWRRELNSLIPRGFLRRDRGGGLFASDYPRFEGAEDVTEKLLRAGYRVEVEGSLSRIDGNEEKYQAFFGALPCVDPVPEDHTLYTVSLAQRLIRADTKPEDEPLDGYPALLKMLDEGKWREAADHAAAWAARCQRQGRRAPSAAGKMLLLALPEGKGGNTPC